jgi:hypothetical protein
VSTKGNGTSTNGSEPPQDDDAETEFDHFSDLAAKLLAVPKAEVNGKTKRKRAVKS